MRVLNINLFHLAAVIVAVAAITAPARSQSARPLPRIELPEFVISGVEQATKLRGERAATEIAVRLTAPGRTVEPRPDLTAAAVLIAPPAPAIERRQGMALLSIFANGGAFESVGGGWMARAPRQKFDLASDGRYQHYPRRIQAGPEWGWNAFGTVAGSPFIRSIGMARAFAAQESYEYGTADRFKILRWSEAGFAATTGPITTRFGTFSGWSQVRQSRHYDLYSLTENEAAIILGFERPVRRGVITARLTWAGDARLTWAGDSINAPNDADGALILVNVSSPAADKFHLTGGAVAARGTGLGATGAIMLWPLASVEFGIPSRASARIGWQPFGALTTRSQLRDRFPMIHFSTVGTFSETPYNLSLNTTAWFGTRWEMALDIGWSYTRHRVSPIYPVIFRDVPLWRMEPLGIERTFTNLSAKYSFPFNTDVSAQVGVAKARSQGSHRGGHAPDVPPAWAALELGKRLANWEIRLGVEGYGKTPLTPDGTVNRPAYADLSATVELSVNPRIKVGILGSNLLNQRFGKAPSYDHPPMAISIKGGYTF